MLHRRLIHILAVTAATCALLAPTAAARSDYPVAPSPSFSSDSNVAAADTVRVPGPTVVVEADESSFNWTSAAIGAGIAAGIVLLAGAAATTTVRHRRTAAH